MSENNNAIEALNKMRSEVEKEFLDLQSSARHKKLVLAVACLFMIVYLSFLARQIDQYVTLDNLVSLFCQTADQKRPEVISGINNQVPTALVDLREKSQVVLIDGFQEGEVWINQKMDETLTEHKGKLATNFQLYIDNALNDPDTKRGMADVPVDQRLELALDQFFDIYNRNQEQMVDALYQEGADELQAVVVHLERLKKNEGLSEKEKIDRELIGLTRALAEKINPEAFTLDTAALGGQFIEIKAKLK